MKKSSQTVVLALAVVGMVFSIALLYWWWSGGSPGESAGERKLRQLQELQAKVKEWDNLDAAGKKAVLADLPQAWQFADEDLRWSVTLILGHAGPDALWHILEALQHPDDDVRKYALWALGIMGPQSEEVIEVVAGSLKDPEPGGLLQDPNPYVRQTAIFALRQMTRTGSWITKKLIGMFADFDIDVRELAGRTVARYGAEAVPDLRKALKHPSVDIRQRAVTTLGLIGPPAAEAVPDLLAVLRDTQSGLQEETAEALAGMGEPALAALAEAVQQEQESALRKRAILALGRGGKRAVPLLAKVLADKDATVRQQATTALGRIGPDAVELLIGALKDEDVEVRQEAARALGTMTKTDAGVVPALVKAASDQVESVRGQAFSSLQSLRLDPETIVAELKPVLEDKRIEVRLDAIRFLGEFGPAAVPRLVGLLGDPEVKVRQRVNETLELMSVPADELFKALAPVLKDENAATRQNAVNILWRCGPPALPKLLEALKKDSNPVVRVAAIRSLHELRPDPKVVFPVLVEALEDESPLVRASAASAVSQFGTRALPQLTQALMDSDAGVRQWAVAGLLNLQGSPKEALPLLVQALQDDITAVREAAAVTLGHFGPAAVPQLIEALKDKEEPVWNKAAKSLKNLKGPPAVIVRALKDAMQHDMVAVRRGAAYALSSFGSDAVDPLIAGLTDKDWGVRWEAADSLRVVGTTGEKALPLLAGLAVSDPEAKVRKIAVEAMLTMQGLDRFRDLPHQAVPELIKGLETRDADGRYQAALVLEAIGPRARDAVPALTKAAQDKDPRVRKAALAALERMK